MDTIKLKKVPVKIAGEILVLAVVLVTLLITSVYLRPIIMEPTLSPNGIGQAGWPFAISASYWDDSSPIGGYKANVFCVRNLLIDILILYVPIYLALELLIGYIGRRSCRENGESRSRACVLRSGKHIAIVAIFLCLIYGAYATLASIVNMPQQVFQINP